LVDDFDDGVFPDERSSSGGFDPGSNPAPGLLIPERTDGLA
jgi:hypothetical protein